MVKIENSAKKRSQWAELWKNLKRNKMALFGLIILVIIVLLALFADQIANYDQLL